MLTKSELKAFLKPKYLFNMKFKDDDLVSQITSLSRGPQGLNVEVAVALNILAMKINTQICCDVSFYEDALYFPVVLDLPFSGDSFAKGSGLFLDFKQTKMQEFALNLSPDNLQMPAMQSSFNRARTLLLSGSGVRTKNNQQK